MNNLQSFFILANPRSGSSLLRLICESHPLLTVPPECVFIEWWFAKYSDWKISDNHTRRLELFCTDLASSKKFETWDFDFTIFKEVVNREKPADYASLVSCVYLAFGLKRKKRIISWGDKNNYYIHKTEFLNTLFPQAKYLYLVRDGRDVAVSYMELQKLKTSSIYRPSLPNQVEEIAKSWDLNNREILSFFEGIESNRVLFLRYEDLVLDLEKECRRICNFLGIPFNENMLEYYVFNKELQLEPKETLDWKLKTLEKPDASGIDKYKKKFTSKELSSFTTIAGQTLKEFGYEV